MEDFEQMLTDLSKPEVKDLRHQNALADQIIRVNNKNALSMWWLLIPLYIIGTLAMKTIYMKTSIKHEINLFRATHPVTTCLLFLVLPLVVIVINQPFSAHRTRAGIVVVALSAFVLLLYILTCYV